MKKLLLLSTLALFINFTAVAQVNWSLSNTGITQYAGLNDFAVAPNGNVFLAGWHYGSIPYYTDANLFKSTDNGLSWTSINVNSLPIGYPKAMIFSGSKLLMCGSSSSGSIDYLYISNDNGAAWTMSNSGINGSYKLTDLAKAPNGDIYMSAALYNSSSTFYSPRLLKSSDNGATWSEITTSGLASIYPSSILFNSSGRMYLSGSNSLIAGWLYASLDYGTNWSAADNGIPLNCYVNELTLGTNGTDVFACGTDNTSSPSVPRLLKTTNNGTNWSVINTTGLSQAKASTAIINSAGTLLLAGNDGITTGSSMNWVFRSGLPQLPAVSTAPVTDVTDATANTGGNVTSSGNVPFVSRGVCWSTSPNPSTGSQTLSAGTGTGIYTLTLSNLQPSTTYYVRAYATNSIGTTYGNEINFTTAVSSGIRSHEGMTALDVHPVPTSGLLYLPVNTSGRKIGYTIYDLMGKAVLNPQLEVGQNMIDISSLPQGCYFLQAEDGQRKKILKH